MMLHKLIAKIQLGELFSYKILKDKNFEVGLNSKYDEYERELVSMAYKIYGDSDKQSRSKCK